MQASPTGLANVPIPRYYSAQPSAWHFVAFSSVYLLHCNSKLQLGRLHFSISGGTPSEVSSGCCIMCNLIAACSASSLCFLALSRSLSNTVPPRSLAGRPVDIDVATLGSQGFCGHTASMFICASSPHFLHLSLGWSRLFAPVKGKTKWQPRSSARPSSCSAALWAGGRATC